MAQAAAKTKKIFDGRYEVLSIVGRGGRSVVYHARTINPPYTEVALKVLLEQKGKSSTGERLRKEALALVSSRHRYVIRLDDFHSVGSLCYLSMEYAPEADLRRYLQKMGGKLDAGVAERFLLQVSEALSFVHKAGIIHRDIKPDNILVANSQEVRLGDFGVAVLPGESATLEELQAGVGTMNYLAPEVLDGKGSDQRADLYALGVTFYEVLTGKNPFEHATMLQQLEVREDKNIPPLTSVRAEIPEYLASAIHRAMAFDPAKRFESVREFTQAILMGKAAANNPIKAAMKLAPAAEEPLPPPTDVADTVVAPPNSVPVSGAVASTPTPAPSEAQTVKPAPAVSETIVQEPSSEEPGHTQAVPVAAPAPSPGGVAQTVVAPPMSKEALKKIAEAVGGDSGPAPIEMTATTFVPREAIEEARRGRKGSLRKFPNGAAHKQKDSAAHIPTEAPSRMRFLAMAGLVLGALFIVVPGVVGAVKKWLPAAQPVQATQGVPAGASPSPIPAFTSQALQFPHLPNGLYTGSISELVPGKTLPLSLISLESSDQLVFVVGMEGWSPVTVNPRSQTKGNASASIRIASTGFILEITGQAVEGEVFGYFKNIVTGAQGEWRARPVRPAGA